MLFLVIIVAVLLLVAFMTVAERKLMGACQRRVGPNVVGYRGILQPIADGVKLLLKETVLPIESSNVIFLGAPLVLFYLSLLSWLVLPVDLGVAISPMAYGILYLLAISELGIWGVVYSGWSANSKYPLIGSLRSTAQMLSYSVSLGLIILTVVMCVGSLDLLEITSTQTALSMAWPLFPMVILFFLSLLAETNRAPFDLPEAESELVAGFMTEHSAVGFVFFFLGEYTNMITMSALMVILFFGGTSLFLNSLLVVFILFMTIWVRSTLPRVRLDYLFRMGWSNILPVTVGYIIMVPSLLYLLRGELGV